MNSIRYKFSQICTTLGGTKPTVVCFLKRIEYLYPIKLDVEAFEICVYVHYLLNIHLDQLQVFIKPFPEGLFFPGGARAVTGLVLLFFTGKHLKKIDFFGQTSPQDVSHVRPR